MKFKDLQGRTHTKDIRKYRYYPDYESLSQGQTQLGKILTKILPNITIYEELPCFGTGLRLDFYIPNLKIAFEFDGEQHNEYNIFFHGNRSGFARQKQRDILKEQWCETNNIKLIRVVKENLTIENIKELIHD